MFEKRAEKYAGKKWAREALEDAYNINDLFTETWLEFCIDLIPVIDNIYAARKAGKIIEALGEHYKRIGKRIDLGALDEEMEEFEKLKNIFPPRKFKIPTLKDLKKTEEFEVPDELSTLMIKHEYAFKDLWIKIKLDGISSEEFNNLLPDLIKMTEELSKRIGKSPLN